MLWLTHQHRTGQEESKNIYIYRKLRITQTGRWLNQALADRIANLGISLGSSTTNSTIRKKPIDKGIENIPNVSKINNKNVQDALDSDIIDYVIEAAQNEAR